MQLREIVATSGEVASTRARLKKIALLSDCLVRVESNELAIAVKFLSGVLPQGRIGIGGAAIRNALQSAPTAMPDSDQDPTLTEVNSIFTQVAQTKGQGSNAKRSKLLVDLLSRTTADGQRFLGSLIVGDVRHGALEGIMIEAVAKSMQLTAADIRRAVMLTGDVAAVAERAMAEGIDGVRRFSLQLFRPVQPMLADTAEDVDDAIQRMGVAALEYKLDGVRVQVHKDAEEVRVFTRHLKDVTENVPEIVQRVREMSARQLVLDGEVLALRSDGRPHPFQTTMRRFGRKRDIEEMTASLPLSVSFFDCLLVDHQQLIDQTTAERHQALSTAIDSELLMPRMVTGRQDEAQAFLTGALEAGHEGIMAKSTEAAYAAGGRGQSWLKIKPSYTLDLVILAAEWGSGRRKGWLSNLHLGARNPSNGGFEMIGKTFKGLTDEMLTWQTRRLLEIELSRDQHIVYVQPQLVAEIAFNEVQQSPHYSSGFALRFARVKRYRDDKSSSEADTIDMVAKIFARHRQ